MTEDGPYLLIYEDGIKTTLLMKKVDEKLIKKM